MINASLILVTNIIRLFCPLGLIMMIATLAKEIFYCSPALTKTPNRCFVYVKLSLLSSLSLTLA